VSSPRRQREPRVKSRRVTFRQIDNRQAFGAALTIAVLLGALDLALESVALAGLVIAPLVAAAGSNTRYTIMTAAFAFLLAILVGALDGTIGDSDHLLGLAVVAVGGLLAVWISLVRANRELDSVRLEIQYAVARTLYESRSIEQAAPRLLESIGSPFGWELGGLWLVSPPRVLRSVDNWHAPGIDPTGFDKLSRQYVLRPGFGLPGRVWQSGEAAWMADVAEDRNFPRAELASRAGLRGAVGFPIRTSEQVLGVIEFFTRQFREPDDSMLALMAALGSQVGEFIERQNAADALEASEARKGAMLESALDCVITMDHEGYIVEFNPAAELTFGYSAAEAVGTELAQLIIPEELRDLHRASVRRTVETGESRLLGERIEMTGTRKDGSEFPVELAITRIGGHDPPLFTAYLRDITERRRAEEERERLLELERIARVDATQARDQLAAILSGVADGVVAQAPDGELIFANEAAARMADFDAPEELIRASFTEIGERVEVLDEQGEPFPLERLPTGSALRGEPAADATVRLRQRTTGEERWVVVKSTPIRDENGNVTMGINVLEDVTDHKRSERVQRVLAETGRVLGSSLEADEMLERVARLLVPELGDWCVLYLRSDDSGAVAPAAMAFANPNKQQLVSRELASYPTNPDMEAGIARVIRNGAAELIPELSEEMVRAMAQDDQHFELIKDENMRSRIVAPLLSHDRVFGALSLATSDSGRVFDEDDLRLAEEVGRRTGTALENARLYAERSYIASTLQQSLLPPELPTIPGLDAAARFRPTGAGNEVGGDFYDVFEAGGGRWAVILGDVCGKGPDAAAVTALARYTLRAAAMQEGLPSRSLAMLNEALLRQRSDLRFCTVTYAHVEPSGNGTRVRLSSGGHPLPLVLRSDGSVEWVGAYGTLLGVVPDPDLEDRETELGPGDALVFYTDGVSEARGAHGAIDDERLAELVAACAGLDAAGIASRLEADAVAIQDGDPRDDIAVVVLRNAVP
jgi:PAS domain S-box-containing protein